MCTWLDLHRTKGISRGKNTSAKGKAKAKEVQLLSGQFAVLCHVMDLLMTKSVRKILMGMVRPLVTNSQTELCPMPWNSLLDSFSMTWQQVLLRESFSFDVTHYTYWFYWSVLPLECEVTNASCDPDEYLVSCKDYVGLPNLRACEFLSWRANIRKNVFV